jgi:hypothetical protein
MDLRFFPAIMPRLVLSLLLGFTLASAKSQHKPAAPKPSEIASSQIYRNATFAFRFEIPYGWVDRTQQMRDNANSNGQDQPPDRATKATAASNGELLLAIFERPPDAIGDTINSAVIIVSESVAAYPGLKKAEDYIAPLKELTAAKGFKAEGDPSIIEIDSRQLICASFSKPLAGKSSADVSGNASLTMRQSTLIMVAKGRIVSFTFVAGSEDELDALLDGLHFGTAKSLPH